MGNQARGPAALSITSSGGRKRHFVVAAARNLAAEIRGGDLTPFRYHHLGQLVDLGTSWRTVRSVVRSLNRHTDILATSWRSVAPEIHLHSADVSCEHSLHEHAGG